MSHSLSLRRNLLTCRLGALVCLFLFPTAFNAQNTPVRIAVLSFGASETGGRSVEEVRKNLSALENFEIVDRDQSRMAAVGAGYTGSLNMSVQDARDLGAAIGCDFFFTGEAQTWQRSPSDTPVYFEAYASIFLVSARTGRLVSWERPSVKRSTPEDAEKALLVELASQDALHRYKIAMRRALEDESAERAHAVESGTPIVEVMADENYETENGTRPPRPYRRLKPVYPEAAALAEVEATVDALADIDAKGEVGHIEIARWAGYGLDESVINTIKQMHFFPAKRDGVSIPMRVLLRYNFRKPPVQNRAQ